MYQAGFFDAVAYKKGTNGLHARGAMGTDAFKDLYAILTPEQKAPAGQRFGSGMMGGWRMAFSRPGR